MLSFANPWCLLLLPLVWLFLRSFRVWQFLPVANANNIQPGRLGWLSKTPAWCFTAMLSLGIVAFAGPRVYQPEATETIMGRDIIVAVDISGSMSAQLPKPPGYKPPKAYFDITVPTTNQPFRRIDAAQGAFMEFVLSRHELMSGDRIGLYLFDDAPRLAWPLTNDLRQLYRKGNWLPLNFLNERVMGNGTNFGEKGYGPLEAAVDHFAEYGQSPAKVFVLVTDGEDKISDGTKSRLASLLKKHNVSFYVIGVGETLSREEVDILSLCKTMGGQVFRVEKAGDMERCFETINSLEKGPIKVSSYNVFLELYPHVLVLVLAFGILWVLSAALVVVI